MTKWQYGEVSEKMTKWHVTISFIVSEIIKCQDGMQE
jgi:hypothetical protein